LTTKPGRNEADGLSRAFASGAITGQAITPPRTINPREKGHEAVIQITTLRQFDRAKLRASAGKLTVSPSTLLRQYRVTNEEKGVTYRVDFYKASDGRKFATCECAGAQGGHVCKHMGAALPVHLEIMMTLESIEGMRERKAAARFFTPNPAFDPAPGKFTDPEGADADCDPANWQ
jgi:hypothetical protein